MTVHEQLDFFLGLVGRIPVETLYLVVGAGAAFENLFPPVPSDTFVVAGGVLADRGLLDAGVVFAVAWASNILLALSVFAAARRYGRDLFATRWGRWLLRPEQLARMGVFYARHGTITVLVSRFFPVFRVLVPVFAGITGLGFWRTAIPLGVASAVWYAALVGLGIVASRNVPRLVRTLQTVNSTFLIVALVLAVVVGVWWWRSRR